MVVYLKFGSERNLIKLIDKHIKIKLALFLVVFFIIIAIFSLNRIVINQLRNEAKSQAQYLANSYSNAINSIEEDEIKFVIDILLPSINFPIIITSNNEISVILNIEIDDSVGTKEYKKAAWQIVNHMDGIFPPLDLIWQDVKWGEIHYSEPQLINRLKWMPYLEIFIGIIFILSTMLVFNLINKSEKKLIYAGMAKETAHQLGTPVSSLLGWMRLLREEKNENKEILDSMDQDILRLSEISERFSKIGSQTQLKNIFIDNLLGDICIYMENRLPLKSKIKIIFRVAEKTSMKGDLVLLSWAFENIIKNAIDAIGTESGSININLIQNLSNISIDVSDTGKGIVRTEWNNIFRPGFSSKTRGWGLGLSLTRRIIEDIHEGSIKVKMSKPGKTTFRIIFLNN